MAVTIAGILIPTGALAVGAATAGAATAGAGAVAGAAAGAGAAAAGAGAAAGATAFVGGGIGAASAGAAMGAGAVTLAGGATAGTAITTGVVAGATTATTIAATALFALIPGVALVIGHDEGTKSMDCWKIAVRDPSTDPSSGITLRELLDHEHVVGVCYFEEQLLIRNIWDEIFEITFLRLPKGEVVGHANQVDGAKFLAVPWEKC